MAETVNIEEHKENNKPKYYLKNGFLNRNILKLFALVFMTIDHVDDASSLFCKYVAEKLARESGQNVLCTGGIFTDDPTERDISKLYENLDEMIRDWAVFFTDD